MKKIALLLVVAAFAASPAAAAMKHKKKPDDTFAKQSANTMRILQDGMPLVLPSWAQVIYFTMYKNQNNTKKKK
jgi:hypothetical protein